MINVLFFARLREQLGCNKITLSLANDVLTVSDVKQAIIEQYPAWQPFFDNSLLAAVNQHMASVDTTIKQGDEVAFFPPVTGG
jgi:molybdopterin synthase sulfur carrier subunit